MKVLLFASLCASAALPAIIQQNEQTVTATPIAQLGAPIQFNGAQSSTSILTAASQPSPVDGQFQPRPIILNSGPINAGNSGSGSGGGGNVAPMPVANPVMGADPIALYATSNSKQSSRTRTARPAVATLTGGKFGAKVQTISKRREEEEEVIVRVTVQQR